MPSSGSQAGSLADQGDGFVDGGTCWKDTPLVRYLEALTTFALILLAAGCMRPEPPYPNVVPIDTTGNFGAR